MSRIAIIGAGIAGLGCAHFLRGVHEVTVYERAGYCGGHAHTIDLPHERGPVPVDTAFMFFNRERYPGFLRLLGVLGVDINTLDTSFSVRDEARQREWAGPGLSRLFDRRLNLLNPRIWKLVPEILRFSAEAAEARHGQEARESSLLQFLTRRNYSEDFIQAYIGPLSSAVWTTPPELMLELPAAALLGYLENHGLLSSRRSSREWLTIRGGSREYVRRLCAPLGSRIRTGANVTRVSREPRHGVLVHRGGLPPERYDKVIMATHADTALQLLSDATPDERRLLGEFRYQPNLSILHTDENLMPTTRRAWAVWNLRNISGADSRTIPSTHFWLNKISPELGPRNHFLSINRADHITPDKVLRSIHYEHPAPNIWAMRAQGELPGLNVRALGSTETFFAGSYFKGGFHEDALNSAIQLCEYLLGRDPWAATPKAR